MERQEQQEMTTAEGLLSVARSHTPNDEYPDQKFGDFSNDYDSETSKYPWNWENCCMCYRLQVFFINIQIYQIIE